MYECKQEGETALMVPAARGYSIIVECLLQNNADPNIPNRVCACNLPHCGMNMHVFITIIMPNSSVVGLYLHKYILVVGWSPQACQHTFCHYVA